MPAVSIGMTLVMILTVPVSWYSFWGFVVLLWLGYFLSFMHFITVPFQVRLLTTGLDIIFTIICFSDTQKNISFFSPNTNPFSKLPEK